MLPFKKIADIATTSTPYRWEKMEKKKKRKKIFPLDRRELDSTLKFITVIRPLEIKVDMFREFFKINYYSITEYIRWYVFFKTLYIRQPMKFWPYKEKQDNIK